MSGLTFNVRERMYPRIVSLFATILSGFVYGLIMFTVYAEVAGDGNQYLATAPWLYALTLAFVQGVTVMTIHAVLKNFKSYYNPLTMVSDFLEGRYSGIFHFAYHFVGLLVGFVVSDLFLFGIHPRADLFTGRLAFAPNVDFGEGFFAIFLATLVCKIITIIPFMNDKTGKNEDYMGDNSVIAGGAVFVSVLVAFGSTAGNPNPMLYFAKLISQSIVTRNPHLFDGAEFVSYLFAPLVSTLLVSFTYMWMFRSRRAQDSSMSP